MPWYPALLQELSASASTVDALGLIGQMLATAGAAARPKPKKKVPDSGYHPFANPTEMEVYRRGGDDAWSEHLMDGLGDEKFSWKTL